MTTQFPRSVVRSPLQNTSPATLTTLADRHSAAAAHSQRPDAARRFNLALSEVGHGCCVGQQFEIARPCVDLMSSQRAAGA